MKILITGVGGQLGTKLYTMSKHENYGTYFGDVPKKKNEHLFQLNLLEKENVLSLITEINPQLVIHCAAATDVDLCERDKQFAWNTNVEVTRNVADACKKINAKIIYISTAFVFDGSKEIYNEDDAPNPINNYGLTKFEGEKIVQASGLPFIIARTDQLYGWGAGKKQNFVVKMLETLKKGETMEVFQDWYNNPTLIDNLAETVLKLVELDKLGVYHTTGSTFINRYDWAVTIAEIFGLDKQLIIPVTSDKYNPPAKRPHAHVDNTKAQNETGIKLLTVKEGLEFMKRTEAMT